MSRLQTFVLIEEKYCSYRPTPGDAFVLKSPFSSIAYNFIQLVSMFSHQVTCRKRTVVDVVVVVISAKYNEVVAVYIVR